MTGPQSAVKQSLWWRRHNIRQVTWRSHMKPYYERQSNMTAGCFHRQSQEIQASGRCSLGRRYKVCASEIVEHWRSMSGSTLTTEARATFARDKVRNVKKQRCSCREQKFFTYFLTTWCRDSESAVALLTPPTVLDPSPASPRRHPQNCLSPPTLLPRKADTGSAC